MKNIKYQHDTIYDICHITMVSESRLHNRSRTNCNFYFDVSILYIQFGNHARFQNWRWCLCSTIAVKRNGCTFANAYKHWLESRATLRLAVLIARVISWFCEIRLFMVLKMTSAVHVRKKTIHKNLDRLLTMVNSCWCFLTIG